VSNYHRAVCKPQLYTVCVEAVNEQSSSKGKDLELDELDDLYAYRSLGIFHDLKFLCLGPVLQRFGSQLLHIVTLILKILYIC